MNEEEDKRKTTILCVLFGSIFLMIFIYSLVRLVSNKTRVPKSKN